MLVMILLSFMMMFSSYGSVEQSIYHHKSLGKEQIYFYADHCSVQPLEDSTHDNVHKRAFFIEGYQWSAPKQQHLNELMKSSLAQTIECKSINLPKKGVMITIYYNKEYTCRLQKASPFDRQFKGFILELFEDKLFNAVLGNTQALLHYT